MRDRQADSPVRDRQGPNVNDSDDSEVIINRNAGRRRQSRSREMVNVPRTDLNNRYDEMRQLRNEVYRVRNRTHRLDTQQRNPRNGFSDEELDINNNETPNNWLTRTDDSSEGPALMRQMILMRSLTDILPPLQVEMDEAMISLWYKSLKSQQHTRVNQGGESTLYTLRWYLSLTDGMTELWRLS